MKTNIILQSIGNDPEFLKLFNGYDFHGNEKEKEAFGQFGLKTRAINLSRKPFKNTEFVQKLVKAFEEHPLKKEDSQPVKQSVFYKTYKKLLAEATDGESQSEKKHIFYINKNRNGKIFVKDEHGKPVVDPATLKHINDYLEDESNKVIKVKSKQQEENQTSNKNIEAYKKYLNKDQFIKSLQQIVPGILQSQQFQKYLDYEDISDILDEALQDNIINFDRLIRKAQRNKYSEEDIENIPDDFATVFAYALIIRCKQHSKDTDEKIAKKNNPETFKKDCETFLNDKKVFLQKLINNFNLDRDNTHANDWITFQKMQFFNYKKDLLFTMPKEIWIKSNNKENDSIEAGIKDDMRNIIFNKDAQDKGPIHPQDIAKFLSPLNVKQHHPNGDGKNLKEFKKQVNQFINAVNDFMKDKSKKFQLIDYIKTWD